MKRSWSPIIFYLAEYGRHLCCAIKSTVHKLVRKFSNKTGIFFSLNYQDWHASIGRIEEKPHSCDIGDSIRRLWDSWTWARINIFGTWGKFKVNFSSSLFVHPFLGSQIGCRFIKWKVAHSAPIWGETWLTWSASSKLFQHYHDEGADQTFADYPAGCKPIFAHLSDQAVHRRNIHR